MKSRLLTAAEIAAMRLPGLPTTKANVIARADRENWYFEEQTGLGGKRRVYAVPAQYLPVGEEASAKTGELLQQASQHVAARHGAGELDEGELIQQVVLSVETWLERNNLKTDAKRKAALVALLFRYFKDQGYIDENKLNNLLQAVA